MGKKSHHVIPHPDGGWSVLKGGATRSSKRFGKKEEAVSWGRKISRDRQTELVIHKRDGTIQRKETVGLCPGS